MVLGRAFPRLHQRPLAAGADERNDLLHQRFVGEFNGDGVEALGKHARTEEKSAVGVAQPVQLSARRAAPAQPDDVEPTRMAIWPLREAERNDVARNAAQAADHGALADADELMDRGMAAEKGVDRRR